jgi:hypothetical protein
MTREYKELENECLYFTCECTQKDHMIEFEVEDWSWYAHEDHRIRRPEDIKLTVTPLLNPKRPLYKRVWIALRYIFGRPHRYHWNFDTVQIPATELAPLEKMIRRAMAVAKLREVNIKNKK